MKIGIASDLKNQNNKTQLINFLKENKFEVINIKSEKFNENNILFESIELEKALHNKIIDKGIIIDDFGIASFMYLSKNNCFVVAQLDNDLNAKLTAQHNNATIIDFASSTISLEKMKKLSLIFLTTKYEGGRHQNRLDLLKKII